jgi:DNA repair ATPase RecN
VDSLSSVAELSSDSDDEGEAPVVASKAVAVPKVELKQTSAPLNESKTKVSQVKKPEVIGSEKLDSIVGQMESTIKLMENIKGRFDDEQSKKVEEKLKELEKREEAVKAAEKENQVKAKNLEEEGFKIKRLKKTYDEDHAELLKRAEAQNLGSAKIKEREVTVERKEIQLQSLQSQYDSNIKTLNADKEKVVGLIIV